jgi:hypothetical protein
MTAIASIDKCIFLHVESVYAISNDLPALKILTEVSSKTSCPLHHAISSSINPISLTDIVETLKKLSSAWRRNTLLVSGFYLEDQVTLCVLEALAEGFDVHLLCDLISGRDPLLAPILQQRLFQAGAVPSSLGQFLYLWLAAELDQTRANVLQDLQQNYSTYFSVRPA